MKKSVINKEKQSPKDILSMKQSGFNLISMVLFEIRNPRPYAWGKSGICEVGG